MNASRLRTWLRQALLPASVAVAALAVWGCTTPASKPAAKRPDAAADAAAVLPTNPVPKAVALDERPLMVSEVAPERAMGEKDETTLPVREAQAEVKAPVEQYPSTLIKGGEDPDKSEKVQFDFDATPLTEVVPLFATLLQFDYYIDPAVTSAKGAVTMAVNTEMTRREVWGLFEHILWLAGAYASRNPGFVHVLPFSKMPQERRLLAKHEPMANVEVAFIPVLNTKSSEISGMLKPFMTEGATATDIPRLNTLLIVEAPPNMPKLREFIAQLDAKGQAGWPQICLRCHTVDVDSIQEELMALLPVLGLPVTTKDSGGGEIKIVTVPRLQVIVASAALKEVLDEIERWVKVLDKEDAGEQENVFFYNVKHSTVDKLKEALDTFFATSGTTSARPSKTKSVASRAKAPGSSATNRPDTSPTATPQAPAAPTTTPKREKAEGERATIFDTPMVIYADGEQNRLTIRTTQRAYAMVEAMLQRLDVPPRQVMIQAIIADITLDKSTQYGFSVAAAGYAEKANNLSGAMVNTGSSLVTTPVAKSISSGAALVLNHGGDPLAFVTAVAGETNLRVLSAPQILATTDQEAEINVGDKVPVLASVSYNSNNDNDTTSSYNYGNYQNVEYQETGVILRVTPHITAGNEVRLDVSQEVSSAVPTNTGVSASPTIQNRNVNTSLILPDGATAILGGMIQTKTKDARTGVPLLMKIPYLGRLLFSSTDTSETRTELLVLITANVIEDQSTTEGLAKRYEAALREIRERLKL